MSCARSTEKGKASVPPFLLILVSASWHKNLIIPIFVDEGWRPRVELPKPTCATKVNPDLKFSGCVSKFLQNAIFARPEIHLEVAIQATAEVSAEIYFK